MFLSQEAWVPPASAPVPPYWGLGTGPLTFIATDTLSDGRLAILCVQTGFFFLVFSCGTSLGKLDQRGREWSGEGKHEGTGGGGQVKTTQSKTKEEKGWCWSNFPGGSSARSLRVRYSSEPERAHGVLFEQAVQLYSPLPLSVRELFRVVIATQGVQVASHPPSFLLGCLSFLFPMAFVVGVHLQVEPSKRRS